ncbi:Rieske (2Fe-2S) protein [candidate division KSB1 bacterium]|nr:Rieske (2Fe-2S) protein [candidate division KSB1 bacterium]
MERRTFIKKLALGSALLAGILSLLGILRAIVPKLTRDKMTYKLGHAADFPMNTFTLAEKASVFIYRDHVGLRAVSALCTHLGCTLEQSDDGFLCPCHGSSFDGDGRAQSGPAPQSLAWFQVSLAPDGQLVVDKTKRVSSADIFRIT